MGASPKTLTRRRVAVFTSHHWRLPRPAKADHFTARNVGGIERPIRRYILLHRQAKLHVAVAQPKPPGGAEAECTRPRAHHIRKGNTVNNQSTCFELIDGALRLGKFIPAGSVTRFGRLTQSLEVQSHTATLRDCQAKLARKAFDDFGG